MKTYCIPCKNIDANGFCAVLILVARMCKAVTDKYDCSLSNIWFDYTGYDNPYFIGNGQTSCNTLFEQYFSCFANCHDEHETLDEDICRKWANDNTIDYKQTLHSIMCSVQDDIMKHMQVFISTLDISSTLGVKFRGTDYRMRPVNHAKQLTADEFIDQIVMFLMGHTFIKTVFAATESMDFVDKLKTNAFIMQHDIHVLSTPYKMFSDNEFHYKTLKDHSMYDVHMLNVDYLTDIFALTSLKFILTCTATSNVVFDLLVDKSSLSYFKQFDIGRYHLNDAQLVLAKNVLYDKRLHTYSIHQ